MNLRESMGTPAMLAMLGVFVGLLVRLLKADRLNALLARFSIPPIPKAWLPWIAILLGIASMILGSIQGGMTWQEAVWAALEGVLAGSLAVAGNETVATATVKASPKAGKVVFGKNPPVEEAMKVVLEATAKPKE